jgi:pyrimidine-specific ribonucleoside hydrolase
MISNFLMGQVAVSSHEEDSHAHEFSGVVFSAFPLHEEDYAMDVQEIMAETIEKYGVEEWRLIVLTSELHGHLGIYAIIGAKMGLYAREILDARHDELVINSLAGSRPPVSCMNDGLQVSTGATLGHGLISVKQADKPMPSAEFTCKGK